MIASTQLSPFREFALNTPDALADFNTLINAPKFSDDPVGNRQKKRWQLIAGDIFKALPSKPCWRREEKLKATSMAWWTPGIFQQPIPTATI